MMPTVNSGKPTAITRYAMISSLASDGSPAIQIAQKFPAAAAASVFGVSLRMAPTAGNVAAYGLRPMSIDPAPVAPAARTDATRPKLRSNAALIKYRAETTKATMNDAYAEMTSGTWTLIQYDCKAGTAGMYPSFQVVA